ncbi:hypothetical protein DM01DRAFT_1331479 [Hesseltinella vesiculosa]|uniref:Uncharacterized protein n=1 Tax=Hesseltinella vesiculosa TaxID=101127 RepID=A0A1X2GVF5_9FUNG|nr:hypothetical protein DM01DRAFT_1331479 [Hesseltinella vesiculosa]
MTDTYAYSPVIRIPKQPQPGRKESLHSVDDFLVSDTIFMSDLPASIRETDIRTLLQHCLPVEMHIRRHDEQDEEESYLRFSSPKLADRAYTLFHQFKFTNGAALELRMYRDPTLDPEPQGDVLEIVNLSSETNNPQRLYDVFRPFGPLYLCEPKSADTAVVQYFNPSDAEDAIYQLNDSNLDGNLILVIHPGGKDQPGTPTLTLSPALSPPPSTPQELAKPHPPSQPRPYTPTSTYPSNDPARQPLNASPFGMTTNGNTVQNNTYPVMPGITNHYGNSTNSVSHSTSTAGSLGKTGKMAIDYTNLYVKNMDTRITNELLHELFGKFGRIVSARVISHPATKQSRGYGFVSFSHQQEATFALTEMNGKMVFDKPLYISYHEPKKTRNNNNSSNGHHHPMTNATSTNSMYNGYAPSLPQLPASQPLRITIGGPPSVDIAPGYSSMPGIASPVVKLPRKQTQPQDFPPLVDLSIGQGPSDPYADLNPFKSAATVKLPPQKATLNELMSPKVNNNTYSTNAAYDLAPTTSPLITDNHADSYNMPAAVKPMGMGIVAATTPKPATLRRRGSLESVNSIMTENTADVQRKRLSQAVVQLGHQERVDDIVDMLLTLKRKERSLCLFNRVFLEEKVTSALEALDTFADDDDDDIVAPQLPPVTAAFKRLSASSLRGVPKAGPTITAPLGRSNPLQPSLVASVLDAPKGMPAQDIDTLLSSISSLPSHTQKQKLGDILWPYIKPLSKPLAKNAKVPGFSSKILVHLLDNVALTELAYGMNDEAWLRTKVEEAAKIVHAS